MRSFALLTHDSSADIFPTFDSFGPLKDVAIIRDKHTGIHRGCAFVTFWNAPDAENARESLHDKFTFPGGKRPAQVKPAEPSCKSIGRVGYPMQKYC
jgi:CUG-BP- and ETR3-like factor